MKKDKVKKQTNMIFVDNLKENKNLEFCNSKFIAHIFSDKNEDGLHTFVEKHLGLKDKQWFDGRQDRKHYDINLDEYYLALKNGAGIKPFRKKRRNYTMCRFYINDFFDCSRKQFCGRKICKDFKI